MVKLIDFMLYYQIKPFEIPSTLVCILICYLSIEAIKQKRADYLSGKIKGCKIGGGFTTGESYYKERLFKYYFALVALSVLMVFYGCMICLKISKGI